MNELTLTCLARDDLTPEMTSFTFGVNGSSPLRFQPGQFLTFAFMIAGRQVERCYSICSSPTRPETLSICVKRVPGGEVSTWLHTHLRTGMTLTATGPAGRFSYLRAPADKYLFISAGSGITPVISMLAAAADERLDADIAFVHSAPTAADIPFRDDVETLVATHPNINATFALTRTTHSTLDNSGHRGRIDAALLAYSCPDLTCREVFLCGPGGFRSSVRNILIASGVPLHRIHEESFGFAVPSSDKVVTTGSGVTVDFTRRARRITVSPGSSILAAAACAGVTLPSSCGVGICGSCKVRKVSGDVVMNHQGGIAPREIEQGKILLCCSEPLSPVEIDY
ncbi:MAG: hybrid-cluster NAD(P)-dependent oxidoreductase [Gordonia sp. (in: high G+C Gram-positive bacteria)]